MTAPPPDGLPALEARLQQDLAWLGLPAKPWVPPHPQPGVLDVAIIGGGMAGLALAASLKHLGMAATVFDRAPAGFEGPWATTARMETLRSPKALTGPALGLPALTFRAWFEAQFGSAAWQSLDKIPRLQWADYLRWYRQVLGLQVHNGQQLVALAPRADGLVQLGLNDVTHCTDGVAMTAEAVDAHRAQGHRTLLARHVVLATGRDGLGGPWVPPWAQQLPRERWMHSSGFWDGATLRGLRVAVIGGGSSAMDAAATALENGARRVDLLIRSADLPRVNKSKGAGSPGMVHGFWPLPDAWKWCFRHYMNAQRVPPPQGSTLRVSRHANAHFHFGAPVLQAGVRADGALRLDTPKGALAADAVIFCTGFRNDWALRPELAGIAPHVKLWASRYTPPAGDEDAELAESPDLGPLFEFQERSPGSCPGLDRVHCFSYPATLSQGAASGDIPQISDGAQRLARGLAARLLADNAAEHFDAVAQYGELELDGTEWTPAAWPPYLDTDAPGRDTQAQDAPRRPGASAAASR